MYNVHFISLYVAFLLLLGISSPCNLVCFRYLNIIAVSYRIANLRSFYFKGLVQSIPFFLSEDFIKVETILKHQTLHLECNSKMGDAQVKYQ